MTSKTAVLGLGNPIMTDEGIGPVLVGRFSSLTAQYPNVIFKDVGTGGFSLLYDLEGVERVVFIDCALMGLEPGTITRFTPDEVETIKRLAHFSLHEGDLLSLLDKARQLGQCPDEVVIFGIQPETIDYGLKLTDCLANRLDEYITVISQEITD
jgi:hydrogenase maturation protease